MTTPYTEPSRKYTPRGKGLPPEEDCDPLKDEYCVPDPSPEAVASQAKERYGGTSESMIRKIVRETIRRKLKKNG